MTGLYTTENLEIPGCLYAADSMSVSTFEVTQPALKKVTYSNVVHYGRSRSLKLLSIDSLYAISYYLPIII